MVLKSEDGIVPDDLTPEEQQELENIRRRKQELLEDIQRLKDEIAEVTSEIENLGSTEERKNMQRNKQRCTYDNEIQRTQKAGGRIQFLIENDLLKVRGDVLSSFTGCQFRSRAPKQDKFIYYSWKRICLATTELCLTDSSVEFRLPGEAQKGDRMMEAFAQALLPVQLWRFSLQTPVTSCAAIIMQTASHNPNVKDKPTVEEDFLNRASRWRRPTEDLLQHPITSQSEAAICFYDQVSPPGSMGEKGVRGQLQIQGAQRVNKEPPHTEVKSDPLTLAVCSTETDKEPEESSLENLSIKEVEDKPVVQLPLLVNS
ncbi:cytohesin-1 isoform X3 [Lates japonicus]|uniref:Cytohesin-1 isoform X3 n=1 Tax=Lates japonicus TaxID=270547 RepID=A0AAD3M8W1_LATJO|nr:cytohesin-1 isoform X3 [Lates japonicus]